MHVLRVRNVNQALYDGLKMLQHHGVQRSSRNGDVLQMPYPVTTVYTHPRERVLFDPMRDANPFFHLYESIWMLGGRSDVAPLVRYVKQMGAYSDDGVTFSAAYGRRWRRARSGDGDGEEYDQLECIIRNLRDNPRCRRQVLQIWDHSVDLELQCGAKDVACNVAATFQVAPDDSLEMVLLCRSNDAIWGAWGANAVHFSILQEYVATALGREVGKLHQVSANLHAYVAVMEPMIDRGVGWYRHYEDGVVAPAEVVSTPTAVWDLDAERFLTDDGRAPTVECAPDGWSDPFFAEVAAPIMHAHDLYKDLPRPTNFEMALSCLNTCAAADWRRACQEWIVRRFARWSQATEPTNCEENT